MANNNSDDQDGFKTWLGRLNDATSFIAAFLGAIIAWQTITLNNEIDRLNQNIEASSLVGDLIGSLTSDNVKQDIALLALDNALASDSEESQEDREERHKELVANIASSLLNRSLSVTVGEDGVSLSRQIREETRTARKILKKLLLEPGLTKTATPDYAAIVAAVDGPTYRQIAAQALLDYEERASASKGPTDQAQAQVNYDKDSASAAADEVLRPEVTVQDQPALQQEQQTLELATAADAVSGVAAEAASDKVAYLHYDEARLADGMEQLKQDLEAESWFVTNAIELVRPGAFNCSIGSDIRFFHEEDEALARELRDQLSETSIRPLTPHVNTVRLIDLSTWEKANLVPERQLEVWIVANGDECASQRSQAD